MRRVFARQPAATLAGAVLGTSASTTTVHHQRASLSATSDEGVPPVPEAGLSGISSTPPMGKAPEAGLYHTPKMNVDPLADRSGRREYPTAVPHDSPAGPDAVPESDRMAEGALKRVGNVLLVKVVDYPFKYEWELNSILRLLKVEFNGQVSIVPDEPKYRAAIFRVRHIVEVQMINNDDLKKMLGIPQHINFRDLAQQIPVNMAFEADPQAKYENYEEGMAEFQIYRKKRLQDIIARDQIELRLLKERKKLKAAMASSSPSS